MVTSVTSTVPLASFSIDDSDSAQALLSALQGDTLHQLRISFQDSVDKTATLVARMNRLANLGQKVGARDQATVTPVTTASANAVVVSAAAAQREPTNSEFAGLFAADGPWLGADLVQASQLYDQILAESLPVAADPTWPVLVRTTQTDAKGNKTVTNELQWLTGSERAQLDAIRTLNPSVSEPALKKQQLGASIAIEYRCLDAFANRRVSSANLTQLQSDIRAEVATSTTALQAVSAFTKAEIEKIASVLSNADQFDKTLKHDQEVVQERKQQSADLDLKQRELLIQERLIQGRATDALNAAEGGKRTAVTSAAADVVRKPQQDENSGGLLSDQNTTKKEN
jgi:hypothetical protein